MQNIIDKIYSKDRSQIVQDILKTYKTKNYLVIDFLYFANLKKFLIDKKNSNPDYIKSLKDCDFLLPDGIALRTYLKSKHKISVQNFNGTDFTPFFLQQVSTKNTHIAFYTVYDEKIGKKKEDKDKVLSYINNNFIFSKIDGFISHYSKRGEDFDFQEYKKILDKNNFDLKIFLVGLGTPFQEIWTYKHLDFFKENNILVMNVGGLFDFRSCFEKRAPGFVRSLNLERAWRFFQSPKKNFGKVLTSFKLFTEIFKK